MRYGMHLGRGEGVKGKRRGINDDGEGLKGDRKA